MKFKAGNIIIPKDSYFSKYKVSRKNFYGTIKKFEKKWRYIVLWSDSLCFGEHDKDWLEDNFQLITDPNYIMKNIV